MSPSLLYRLCASTHCQSSHSLMALALMHCSGMCFQALSSKILSTRNWLRLSERHVLKQTWWSTKTRQVELIGHRFHTHQGSKLTSLNILDFLYMIYCENLQLSGKTYKFLNLWVLLACIFFS